MRLNIFRSLILLAMIIIGSITSFACVCVNMDFSDTEAKAYYNAETFDGAIFTGRITEIRDLAEGEDLGDGMVLPLRELQIEVEQYWFGVENAELRALTLGANTSCTVEWVKNKTLFFVASRNKRGLNVGSCDLANWKGKFPDKEWADYTQRILGRPRTFGTNVKKAKTHC